MVNFFKYDNVFSEKKLVCYGAGVNALLMLNSDVFTPYRNQILFFIDKNKDLVGKTIDTNGISFMIKGIEELEYLERDTLVLVTITDYYSIGKILDGKNIDWISWTVISSEYDFQELETKVKNDGPSIFLLNTPDYMNLGDIAIAVAEDRFIKENFGDYFDIGIHSCHPEGIKKLKKYIKDDDILFVQGGGNMGTLWKICEENLRNIISSFPNNRIVVFPQSVFYGDSEDDQDYLKKSLDIYNNHKKLLICVREKRSYEFVCSSYSCECLLLPDMVLTLNTPNTKVEREGITVLLRNDKEKFISSDYSDIINSAVVSSGEQLNIITHHPVKSSFEKEERVNEILKIYSSSKLVITDRLHGMIFSVITNTPCIAFDNSYHKVSDVYHTWLEKYDSITLADQMSVLDLESLIQRKLNKKCMYYNTFDYAVLLRKIVDYLN